MLLHQTPVRIYHHVLLSHFPQHLVMHLLRSLPQLLHHDTHARRCLPGRDGFGTDCLQDGVLGKQGGLECEVEGGWVFGSGCSLSEACREMEWVGGGRRRGKEGRTVRIYRKGMEDEESSEGDSDEWDGAKETSTQLARRNTSSTPPSSSPPPTSLPPSLSSRRQQHGLALQSMWTTRWTTSTTTGNGLRSVDPRPPGKAFSRPFHRLPH